ncbi:EF-hand domain-containing protein [Hansschlegelia quercus]|uniref:EF-hand domain-containing protein n=1 Tax=Hansschlegelia quercus TaxID=2528245 RepID=A0A4Q9GNQ1_9HYPH|nr:EF-hand domain-containing protein [Hansschlegelia quercus]TBN54815.1 hypothetical protein EYR15_01235 [Hansschlegelia quercus]
MLRTAAASLVAILLASTAGAALAQDNASRKERVMKMNERIEKRFTALDKNRDGAVDKVEAEAGFAKAFDRFDANGDGTVDKAEIAAKVAKGGKRGEAVERRMNKADGDKNGSVTRDEFSKNLPRWFDRADADKDGKVTKAELDRFLDRREKRAEMKTDKAKAN